MASLEPDNSAGLVIGDAVHGQWDSVIEAIAFVVGWLGKYPISCFTQDPLPQQLTPIADQHWQNPGPFSIAR